MQKENIEKEMNNYNLKESQKEAIRKIMKKDSIVLNFPIEMKKNQKAKQEKKSKDRDVR